MKTFFFNTLNFLMMKTLKVKSILFSLLAIMTSCEQDTLTTTSDLDAITQLEKEQAQAEYDLIASYGEQTLAAYQAFVAGETLSYFSPLGVTETVEFDWSNYTAIMEHTKIMTAIEKSGMMDIYKQTLPVGTHLTRTDVEQVTPELVQFIDNPDAITTTGIESRCDTYYGPWNRCSSCATYPFMQGDTFIFVQRRDWCRTVSTCNSCYVQKVRAGC